MGTSSQFREPTMMHTFLCRVGARFLPQPLCMQRRFFDAQSYLCKIRGRMNILAKPLRVGQFKTEPPKELVPHESNLHYEPKLRKYPPPKRVDHSLGKQ